MLDFHLSSGPVSPSRHTSAIPAYAHEQLSLCSRQPTPPPFKPEQTWTPLEAGGGLRGPHSLHHIHVVKSQSCQKEVMLRYIQTSPLQARSQKLSVHRSCLHLLLNKKWPLLTHREEGFGLLNIRILQLSAKRGNSALHNTINIRLYCHFIC